MKIYFDHMVNRTLIKKILEYTRVKLNQPSEIELSISSISERDIRNLNNLYRGVNAVTDVLSFPTVDNSARKSLVLDEHTEDVDFDTGNLVLGDIFICQKRAREQAEEYGHSYERELCFLCLHGFLHLLGYDHIEATDEQQMFALQEQILADLQITRGNAE